MRVFDFTDYRKFLLSWLEQQPLRGRGIPRAWAREFKIHPTYISQILSGRRMLSQELGLKIVQRLGLNEPEADFFFLIKDHNQAGSEELRQWLEKKIKSAQAKANEVASRVEANQVVSQESQAKFYSSWMFAAVRNLSAVESHRSLEGIARHLGLPKENVEKVVEFLLEAGLCVREKGGIAPGPASTHLKRDSVHINRHHENWRLHGISKMQLRREGDTFFTMPMSLSEKDAKQLSKLIGEWISSTAKIVGPSKSETVRCLNIDFFAY